jgi:hypothetical protein
MATNKVTARQKLPSSPRPNSLATLASEGDTNPTHESSKAGGKKTGLGAAERRVERKALGDEEGALTILAAEGEAGASAAAPCPGERSCGGGGGEKMGCAFMAATRVSFLRVAFRAVRIDVMAL